MGKPGGNRNFGYGKQLAWAGKNALADRYGQGHFGTRATHEGLWCQFVHYLKGLNIKDARQIDHSTIVQYGTWLKAQVDNGNASVAYAQKLVSTVNVVLQAMRKDTVLLLSPSVVGERCNVRSTVPASYDRTVLASPITILNSKGEQRVALVAALSRDFGLRFREASLLNCKQALKQANRLGQINITQGTKGGRGKGVDRWVPVNSDNLNTLKAAADLQGKSNNIIPENRTYAQWRDHANSQWRNVPKTVPIKGFHDMRAAYACERYQVITGHPAPVIAGQRLASKEIDRQARSVIAQELGHNRLDVVSSYVGSAQ